MGRALLRNPRILCLDEATASVDMETDFRTQTMVRSSFKNVTTLTIAHRLNTIMDYDRVMVLDKGRVVEFDKPLKLLQNPDGVFTSMVNATGPVYSKVLYKIAAGELDVTAALQTDEKVN
jgi:ABC-type multidrug transport system fused ATPase/permease subunit